MTRGDQRVAQFRRTVSDPDSSWCIYNKLPVVRELRL